MRIGQLAAATEVTAHTLRFWEQRGLLLDPGRTPGGYRDYPPAAVERVAFVRRAQAAGLTRDQIQSVLDVSDDGQRPCPQVAAFVIERLAEVDARLDELAHTRSHLAALRTRLDRQEDGEPINAKEVCPAIDRHSSP
jgi:DNA-binding transcriptional MerR regulator